MIEKKTIKLPMNLWAFDHLSTAVGNNECPKRNAAEAKASIIPGLMCES